MVNDFEMQDPMEDEAYDRAEFQAEMNRLHPEFHEIEDVSQYDIPEDPCGHGDVTESFRIECLECGKRFTTEEDDVEEIRCPSCGGVDLEVA